MLPSRRSQLEQLDIGIRVGVRSGSGLVLGIGLGLRLVLGLGLGLELGLGFVTNPHRRRCPDRCHCRDCRCLGYHLLPLCDLLLTPMPQRKVR